MRRITGLRRWAAAVLSALLLAGCGGQGGTGGGGAEQPEKLSLLAMDTLMNFTVYGDASLLDGVRDIMEDTERRVSVTSPTSEIYRLNQNGGGTVSAETADLLETALSLCAMTDGALDVTVYPVVRAWGFTTGDYRVPSDGEIQSLLERVDYRRVHLDGQSVEMEADTEIDLGSVAKGYAGREAAAYLRRQGVTSALLNLGGNVQTVGAKPDGSPWRIAVQDPFSDELAAVLELADKAAVTSGGYQRYFTGDDGQVYWHIMDPATGRPARSGLVSVTIVAEDGAYCDALSTALFIMGRDGAVRFWREQGDFDMVLITEDGELYATPGLTVTQSAYTVRTIEP